MALPMMTSLADSPNLVPTPPVDPEYAAQLGPKSFASWTKMFEAHSKTLHFLLEPGDYRSWGVLRFEDNHPGPGDDRPRTMRYHNPKDQALHPVKRLRGARLDSLQFAKEATKNWFVQGLTISVPSANPGINEGSSNITVDYCLIEDVGRYGFRIRNTKNCTIQRCVIRESTQIGSDSTGIQVGSSPGAEPITGIRILDNEIYNMGDGIQVTDNATDPWLANEVLIEGNDIYLEPSRYTDDNTTSAENAIDIKAGSDRPMSTVIRGNRMWGIRRNADPPTAQGELLVLQNFCRKVVVEDNIMGDAPRGMKDENWPTDKVSDVNKEREIVFRNNQFYEIRDYAAADRGAITKPIAAGIEFFHNWFARSDWLADVGPPAYRDPRPVYRFNILVEVGGIQRPEDESDPLPYTPAKLPFDRKLNFLRSAPNGFETYERRRWTGPEHAYGAIPRSA